MKVVFTNPARLSLDRIYDWYKSEGKGLVGRRVRAAIIKKGMILKSQPLLGPVEETLKELELGHRYLVEGNHKIIYRVMDQTVLITDVFDTRQDPDKMKA